MQAWHLVHTRADLGRPIRYDQFGGAEGGERERVDNREVTYFSTENVRRFFRRVKKTATG